MGDVSWTLDPWDALLRYISTLERECDIWRRFFESDFQSDHIGRDDVLSWITDMSRTFTVFRQMYVYDSKHTLSVSQVASGFPERFHVHQLAVYDESADSVSEASVRRMFLDDLFKHKHANQWLLERVAKAGAASLRKQGPVLALFRVRSVRCIDIIEGQRHYAMIFERYCYRNIPALYVMYFDCDGEFDAVLQHELEVVLEEETSRLPLLGDLATAIDRAIAPIHPYWVGRVTAGPIFISRMTRDDHELQQVLDQNYELGAAAASRLIYEYVVSEKSFSAQRLYDAKGRNHSRLQDFVIRQLDEECRSRQVTHVEKHLFAPHFVVQNVSEIFRSGIGHVIQSRGES